MTAQQTFRNTLVVVLTLAAVYAAYASIDILIVLLIAIIVASAIRPSVLWLHRHGVPEGLAILMVYLGLLLAIFLLGVVVLPPAANQLAGYLGNDQNLSQKIIDTQTWIQTSIQDRTGTYITLLQPDAIRATVSHTLDSLKAGVPALAGQFGGILGDLVLVLVMGVYWLTSRDQAVNTLLQLFPIGRRAMIAEMISEIENSMGMYVRGIVLVCTFVGVANFAILSILRVPNAVTLGFIVGVTTALPIIGGYVGAATAILLALLSSPLNALFALLSFVGVQQVENHYLTPRVMSRSVGLNPILIIVALFIGFAVGGVIGALISVPVAGTIMIFLRHLVLEPRKEESAPQFVEGGILLPGTKESTKDTKPIIITTDQGRSTTTTP